MKDLEKVQFEMKLLGSTNELNRQTKYRRKVFTNRVIILSLSVPTLLLLDGLVYMAVTV